MNYLKIPVLFALCSTMSFAFGQEVINLTNASNSTDYSFELQIATSTPLIATGNPAESLGQCKSSEGVQCYTLKKGVFTFTPATVTPTPQNTSTLSVTGGDDGYSIIVTNILCKTNKSDTGLDCSYTLPQTNN